MGGCINRYTAQLLLYVSSMLFGEVMEMDQGSLVTYRDFRRKMDGSCGIVEGMVQGKPDFVLVRWAGNQAQSEECVSDLEEV